MSPSNPSHPQFPVALLAAEVVVVVPVVPFVAAAGEPVTLVAGVDVSPGEAVFIACAEACIGTAIASIANSTDAASLREPIILSPHVTSHTMMYPKSAPLNVRDGACQLAVTVQRFYDLRENPIGIRGLYSARARALVTAPTVSRE